MFAKLLTLIESGGVYTPENLAAQLGTTPQIVTAMLDDLSRRQWLKASPVQPECSQTACSGCPLTGGCTPARMRLWEKNI